MTTVTNILIGFIVFGMVITGVTIFWGDLNNNYGIPINDNFSKTLNVVNETTAIAYQMSSASQGANQSSLTTTEITWYDAMQQQIFGFTSALKLAWKVPALFQAVLDDLSFMFGLPPWFTVGLMAIFIVAIIAAIYYAITGRLF